MPKKAKQDGEIGYQCRCGHWNSCKSAWAAAHWDMELYHTCEGCQKQNVIKSGKYIRRV